MPDGPGKYNELCTEAREGAQADGAVLIILNGAEGHGFSVQAHDDVIRLLPALLRNLADSIEADIKAETN